MSGPGLWLGLGYTPTFSSRSNDAIRTWRTTGWCFMLLVRLVPLKALPVRTNESTFFKLPPIGFTWPLSMSVGVFHETSRVPRVSPGPHALLRRIDASPELCWVAAVPDILLGDRWP